MSTKMTLAEWIRREEAGDFNSYDVHTMIEAGWFDWFCSDKALFPRLKKMKGMVKAAAASSLVDADKTYVFFKNNCPFNSPTYDSFSIVDRQTEDVIYWVTAKDGHIGEAMVTTQPDFDQNLLAPGGNANDVKAFFKNA